jgi:putative DNA primase/helicase
MNFDLPQRPMVLDPILSSQSLALLYGPRGIGKTFMALGIAWAAASGGSFLGWQAPRPRQVVYIDGETAAIEMRERLRLFGGTTETIPDTLTFLLGDLHKQDLGLPDLGSVEGQLAIGEQWGAWPDLLVLDNLSSLIAPQHNGDDCWSAIQSFLLYMRRHGTAVLIVHHADKKGQQRGTSRHEDVLDLVLALRPPNGQAPHDGAHFEIHFEKARRLHGDIVKPIEAWLTTDDDGAARWQWRSTPPRDLDRVATLLKDGLNPNQIARRLGISKSKSYRLKDEVMGRAT